MAKRVDLSNTSRNTPRSNKFERLNKSPKKSSFSVLKIVGRILFYIWISTIAAVVLYKFVPVAFTPTMASRKIEAIMEGKPSEIHSQWTSYDEIDRNCALAIIASEDQLFPEHKGFDFEAMTTAFAKNRKGKKIKGASTISQQVAKNVFLWQDRSYFRKALEAYFTVLIELVLGKERILEVYLNVAETGKMTFGVEEACRRYYGHTSAEVSTSEAARMAACLPNPIKFSVANPSGYVVKRTAFIKRQMAALGGKKFLKNL
jgi:monofunctional biosynthetic peptidoglycan transglycosylase